MKKKPTTAARSIPPRGSTGKPLDDAQVKGVRNLAKTVIGWTTLKELLNQLEDEGKLLNADRRWKADFDKILRLTKYSRIPMQAHHDEVLRRTLRKGLCEKFHKKDEELDSHTASLSASNASVRAVLGLLNGASDPVNLKKTENCGQFLAHAKAKEGIVQPEFDSVAKLYSSASESMERDYVALSRDGRYDSAASLAMRAVAGAEAAEDKRLVAHWADRVADAYRAIGMLREASALYAVSWAKAQEALAQTPDNLKLRYQIGKTRFGQIMVDDYLVRGAFAEAHSRHAQLLSDVDALLRDGVPESLRTEIFHRRIHIKRQQAEMLRYLGRYGEALKNIREVLNEYPVSAHEPRSYARLSEADSLRLQGDMNAASTIYAEVETTARERRLDGLLGSVLWRKACLLQLAGGDSQFDNCLKEVAQLADENPQRYRFMVIYSLLLLASGKVADAGKAGAALRKAEKFGPLRSDYLVAEYAHAALCRGEISRQFKLPLQAADDFETAFLSYARMECRWGMVRAWIGLRLAGRDVEFPDNVKRTLEGTDAKLFQKFGRSREIEP